MLENRWVITVITVIIGLLCLGIWHSTVRTDVLNDAKVDFWGYNGNGYANVTRGSEMKIKKLVLIGVMRGDGVDKSAIDYVKESDPYRIDSDKIRELANNDALVNNVESVAQHIYVNFTENSGLKNGDRVKAALNISNAEAKKYRLSIAPHTYTVKGLKKTTSISIKDIKKSLNVKFYGLDKYGTMIITSKKYANKLNFDVPMNNALHNGDEIKLELPDEFIQNLSGKGIIYKGTRTYTVTVSGLKSADQIKNVPDVVDHNDKLAHKLLTENKTDYQYKDSKILKSYLFTYNPIPKETIEHNAALSNSEVDVVAKKSDSPDNKNVNLTALTLFEIRKKDNDDKHYFLFGYSNLHLKNDEININSKKGLDDSYFLNIDNIDYMDTSLSSIERELESNGSILK